MGRKTVDQPKGSTERARRFRKRRALIDTFTILAYSTNDNASLEALQSFLDSINKDTQEETVEANQ
ncbi:hypothetical protein [Pseudomonas anguilliseptica]|uniref:Uncharacterized protein n=1 Tax=Pseudomonas anguilliseptica TaxID=53406 RepID=A0A1H5LB95_PSEAG|nr:hypothetical protein [Pseudomonas anguilliseptica]SEE74323.1 hypothetical protein SAMN05421553_4968 [Pseudomonas anguilliseptica]